MASGLKMVGGLLSVILGAYLMNFQLAFFKVPDALAKSQNYILFVAGILLILGGVMFLLSKGNSGRNYKER